MAPKKKGMSNAAITKAFGKRGSLHKAMGVKPNQKIGRSALESAAKGGGRKAKQAQLALNFDYRGKKK